MGQLTGHRPTETVTRIARGVEVPSRAEDGRTAAVVAVIGVVECQLHEARERKGPSRRDLTADPAASIERLYRELDLPMSDAYRDLLASEGKRARDHKPRHTYSLAEFGLEAGAIRTELATLFERFQWDADDPVSARSQDLGNDDGPSE